MYLPPSGGPQKAVKAHGGRGDKNGGKVGDGNGGNGSGREFPLIGVDGDNDLVFCVDGGGWGFKFVVDGDNWDFTRMEVVVHLSNFRRVVESIWTIFLP